MLVQGAPGELMDHMPQQWIAKGALLGDLEARQILESGFWKADLKLKM